MDWCVKLQLDTASEAGITQPSQLTENQAIFTMYEDWRRIPFTSKLSLRVKRTEVRCVNLEIDTPVRSSRTSEWSRRRMDSSLRWNDGGGWNDGGAGMTEGAPIVAEVQDAHRWGIM